MNSSTKEVAIDYLNDIGVGLGVTSAASDNVGITTIFTDSNHNLNTITGITITNGGTGYAVGDNITLSQSIYCW